MKEPSKELMRGARGGRSHGRSGGAQAAARVPSRLLVVRFVGPGTEELAR